MSGTGPGRVDDPESPDAATFDLTPRTGPSPSPRRGGTRPTRRWVAVGALVVVIATLGYVLLRGIGDAATFFYNVDEAVARKDDLGSDRFRVQGNVVADSIVERDGGVDFVLRYAGVELPVRHTGTPPELFGPDIPVVLEGRFVGDTFVSDQILIKHDSSYDERNPDRIADAEADARTDGQGGEGTRGGSGASGDGAGGGAGVGAGG